MPDQKHALLTPAAPPEPIDLPTPSVGGPSIIGSTLVMKGSLTLDEDLIIDGRFEGTRIEGAHQLSISTHAAVKADIYGDSAEIAGTLDGAFEGSGTVLVRRTARIKGEISAGILRIENGTNLEDAILSGRISLTDPDLR